MFVTFLVCFFFVFLWVFLEFLFGHHIQATMVTIYYHFILFLLQFNGNIICVIANLFFD